MERPAVTRRRPVTRLAGATLSSVLSWPLGRCVALAVGVVLLGLVGSAFRPPGAHVTLWWPAAALSFTALALSPARFRARLAATVVVAAAVVNHLAGAPPVLSVVYGVANAAEALLVTWLFLRATGGRARLTRLADTAELLLAAVAGALVAGLIAGSGVALLADGDAVLAGRSVTLSHLFAVITLAPLLLLDRQASRGSARLVEVLAQNTTFVLVSLLVFGPWGQPGLTFLHGPVLLWALLRLGGWACMLQTSVLGSAAALATVYGWGPFPVVHTGSADATVIGTQLFMAAYAMSLLPLAVGMTQRREAMEALGASETFYRLTFQEALSGMLAVRLSQGDPTSLTIMRANPVAAELLAPATGDPSGTCWQDVVVAGDREVLVEAASRVASGSLPAWHAELRHVVNGEDRWVDVALTRLPQQNPGEQLLMAQLVDVTHRRVAEARLRELALHDQLTGLPNRSLLADRIAHALVRGRRDGTGLALFFCDLDDFKVVNDTAGHAVGDQLLVTVARRVVAAVRPGDTVARIGGDEFVVLSPGAGDPRTAQGVAQRLLRALEAPVELEGRTISVGASIGIALSDPDSTAESLLRQADVAMYAAKAEGKNRATPYHEDQSTSTRRRVQLGEELRRAVAEREFRLHVQPVVDVASGTVVAGEALLRWQHPTRGLLGPAEFLDVLETSPLIMDVGRWVLTEATTLASDWFGRFGPLAPAVHVNVAARQLERGELADVARRALAVSGLPPDRLVLELTETQLSRVDATVLAELRALAATGVTLAADDFGTGYSPLTWLTDLPLGMLKIDRQFVSGVVEDERARAVVQAVVGMSGALGLDVVGEGVETPEQALELRRLGCLHGQGFLWSRPVPPEDFLAQVTAAVEPAPHAAVAPDGS